MRALSFSLILSLTACRSGASVDDAAAAGHTFPGIAVAATSDGLFVLQPSTTDCRNTVGDPCVGRGCVCTDLSDGALVRYGLGLDGAPEVIASGLLARPGAHLAIVDGYAIVIEAQHAYALSITNGSRTPLSAEVGERAFAADGAAVYAEDPTYLEGALLKILPASVDAFTVNAPRDVGMSAFFNVADGYLYFPTDCQRQGCATCGVDTSPCAASGIQRARAGGGALEPVRTVGANVGAVAARGNELYYASAGAIFHADLQDGALPRELHRAPVGIMGLTAIDGGVLAATPGAILFLAADASTERTVLTVPLSQNEPTATCDTPVWSAGVVACRYGRTIHAARLP